MSKAKLKISALKYVYRDRKHFDANIYQEEMVTKLNNRYSDFLFNNSKSQYTFKDIISTFSSVLSKHAPEKMMPYKQLKYKNKPWLTTGLLKFTETKNKMFNQCYSNKNPALTRKYKQYSSKLTTIKHVARKAYYKEMLQLNETNMSKQQKINCLVI